MSQKYLSIITYRLFEMLPFKLCLSLLTAIIILTTSCNLIKPPFAVNQSKINSSNSSNAKKAIDCNKISIFLPETDNAERYERSDRPELERQITKKLINKVEDLMLLYFNANGDAKLQIEQAKFAFQQGVCLLIVDPVDKSINIEILKMANQKKIPVIAYDRILEEGNDYAPYFVSFDTIKVGEFQGQYIADQVKLKNQSQYNFQAKNNKYVMINGKKEDNNTKLLVKGFKNSVQGLIDRGEITPIKIKQETGIQEEAGIWYSPGWSGSEAAKKMKEILQAHPDLKIAWVGNDNMAISIINDLEPQYKGKILITGQDGTRESLTKIKKGEQSMTVCKDSKDLAKQAAILVEELFEGKEPKSQQIDGLNPNIVYRISKEIHSVTKDNMKSDDGTVNSCLKMLGINDPNNL